MAIAAEKLKAKDYKSTVPPTWCPGCGDYSVLNSALNAYAELGIDMDNTVNVSGIGCSSRFPYFVKTYGMHTAHGRALPAAMGVQIANPSLRVFVTGGDGDGFSIGGGHVPHVARKNVDITYIVMDNQIYGLTKGQVSPTSRPDFVATTTPYGTPDEPIDPILYTLTYGATFVARASAGNPKMLRSIIVEALNHRGFAFVDVLSACPTFNKVDTPESYKANTAEIPEGHDRKDFNKAMDLAINGVDGKMALGVLYQVEKPTLNDKLEAINKKANGSDTYDLNKIVDLYKP
ncbi:MAG: 2-oxoacid:ferredoxin oxidoreductase subunit beta [Thermodesulfobacteriota bacterium]